MSKQSPRRPFLAVTAAQCASFVGLITPSPSYALVKGNAPPPPRKKSSGDNEKKCTNLEECQEMAIIIETQELEKVKAKALPSFIAPGGSRYQNMREGDNGEDVVKNGDEVTIKYKVLKLGKRSYDGLSGEGTVVFSRGYGLEDDEQGKNKNESFTATIGSSNLIRALSDGMINMKVGGVRRISVPPQMGWEKPTPECDGGPGGRGSGGDVKVDYVVIPTATMVATEICMDKAKSPFPNSYAEQRRMAQRFDQSLIIEVELLKINQS
eukprot:CAMPEP_0194361892 /NCGR_PEP_ID=MMETSP0174-20130528/9532_1 /TAXON_ID=216777 /ORGANISM="Proboscia alata, Strain PI-D3" /LENGTH=266 /DNA_ID=CAMNT_0039134375 /DNA_START=168 /DNA_END=968 /DNA_ORIENTATION=-